MSEGSFFSFFNVPLSLSFWNLLFLAPHAQPWSAASSHRSEDGRSGICLPSSADLLASFVGEEKKQHNLKTGFSHASEWGSPVPIPRAPPGILVSLGHPDLECDQAGSAPRGWCSGFGASWSP